MTKNSYQYLKKLYIAILCSNIIRKYKMFMLNFRF